MVDQVERHLQPLVVEALSDTRVVGVVGPRQAGKSTLVHHLVDTTQDAEYVSLDDQAVRTAAERDPDGFVAGRPGLLAIDEVQRVPDLLLAIKAQVDRDQRPGQFLITGSSALSATRGVSETLAGRIERFELWPFSQGERRGHRETFVDRLLAGGSDGLDPGHRSGLTKADYLQLAAAGGFPEAIRRRGARRGSWFDSYVETVVEREAPGIAASPRTAELPRLLRLIAARHAGLLNVADLSRDAGLPERSVHRYLEVLEAVFLVRRVPAWSANLSQREIRAPKIFVTDSGLATHLRGIDPDVLSRPDLALGAEEPVLEGLVYDEIVRQTGWSTSRVELMHYRDRQGVEVDLLLEDRRRRVVGIEVKSGTDIGHRDVRHLATLRDSLGDRFIAGVILHSGRTVLPLGDRLNAVPISALWS